jgi:hypothetical protein
VPCLLVFFERFDRGLVRLVTVVGRLVKVVEKVLVKGVVGAVLIGVVVSFVWFVLFVKVVTETVVSGDLVVGMVVG